VQAILAVDDLLYLAGPVVVASLCLEDVTAWLELHDIRFTPKVKFTTDPECYTGAPFNRPQLEAPGFL
jgi:hypothetical protein